VVRLGNDVSRGVALLSGPAVVQVEVAVARVVQADLVIRGRETYTREKRAVGRMGMVLAIRVEYVCRSSTRGCSKVLTSKNASMAFMTFVSSQKSKIGCSAPGPRATHEDCGVVAGLLSAG